MDLFTSDSVLLLDGGLSNELNNRVDFDIHSEPLWTAKALLTNPNAVIDTHLSYLKAGADIIETASYQATLEGFKEFMDVDEKTSEKLIEDSCNLAKTAVQKFKADATDDPTEDPKLHLVAGSIGPYGVYLRDGSEYSGNYMRTVTKENLDKMHLPRIMSLVRGGVDIIAIETMPALEEVEVILELLKNHAPSTKAWVAFSIKEHDPSSTAFGDIMEVAFNKICDSDQVVAFGINCCRPKEVTEFLKLIATFKARGNSRVKKMKIVVYPNSGQEWIRGKGWIKDPVPTLDSYVTEWLNLGANIIGGCCQVGSDHISKMRPIIDKWNREKSHQ